jgi:hypothetical protein
MRTLCYTGDFSDYLVNLCDLNQTLGLAGRAFRDQVEAQLPDDIINMMYMLRPIPEDDDDFLQVVELAGKRIEEIKRRAKARSKMEIKTHKNSNEKEKEKEKVKNKNGETKKEKKDNKNKNNYKKDTQEKKIKEEKFALMKEALDGISELLIQKHKTTGVSCWRCGRNNHYTTECYAKTTEYGENLKKPKVSSQPKRKRNDDDKEEENDKKKAKTAVVRAEPEEVKER